MENEDNYKENYEIMDIDEIFNKLETPSENNIIYNIFNLISILNDKIYCFIENNQIDVYKINQEENIFEKIPSVLIIKEYNEKPINISKGILNKGEQNILFLDEKNPYNVYQYDLTKEKIIKE